jgi:hypothetical protein
VLKHKKLKPIIFHAGQAGDMFIVEVAPARMSARLVVLGSFHFEEGDGLSYRFEDAFDFGN